MDRTGQAGFRCLAIEKVASRVTSTAAKVERDSLHPPGGHPYAARAAGDSAGSGSRLANTPS